MKVSIVIPVFNAANYVTQAVDSALAQPETDEILLIEDGSIDDSLVVCQALAEKHAKVRLLRHLNGQNRGAGASRNLGMKTARNEYIAFLDADDYFLPGRFRVAKKIFEDNPRCDGVYEAIERHVEDDQGLGRWNDSGRSKIDFYTMSPNIDPDHLGIILLEGNNGHFSIDGFVIKKSVLNKSDYMSENLKLHQDTEFIIRVAITSFLLPGKLNEPVARWRVHQKNRISAPRSLSTEYRNRMLYFLTLYHWAKENASSDIQKKILQRIITYTKAHKYFRHFPRAFFPARLIRLTRLLRLFRYPEIVLDTIKPASILF